MGKWFQKQSRLLQIILLLIPGVNWVVEILVRVSSLIERVSLRNILGLIFGVILPCINGWIDVIWCLLFKHMFLCKA